MVTIPIVLWSDISISDTFELKLEEKADSVFIFDLDDIVRGSWIFLS